MAKTPVINDTIAPINNCAVTVSAPVPKRSLRSSRAAPRVAGSARRKENFAESSLDIPDKSPAVMVIPDLDIPGTMAIAWAMPVTRARHVVTVESGVWPSSSRRILIFGRLFPRFLLR